MLYPQSIIKRVLAMAREAAQAHAAGATEYTATQYADGSGVRQTLDLDAGGWCWRFIRQLFEVALGLQPGTWEFASASAKQTLTLMHQAGRDCSAPLLPGDIAGIRGGTWGHIALYLGDGLVAENTSSDSRGKPRRAGTKITPYSDLSGRVTETYRLGLVQSSSITITWEGSAGPLVLSRNGRMDGDVCVAPVREMAEALGFTVVDHRGDLGRVCLAGKPTATPPTLQRIIPDSDGGL